MTESISIIIPARNEAASLNELLPELKTQLPDAEIIVVNDASSDDTSPVCKRHDVTELKNIHNLGNGGSVKRGARAASGDVLIMMDADGQHQPSDIPLLLEKFGEDDYDMVVGARSHKHQASIARSFANGVYNTIASWMVGQPVIDLTSGFRIVKAARFREFLHLMPNGFSYPTTSTMAFFRSGYLVGYQPVNVLQREGSSHIRPMKDGLRFLLIIFKIGSLYSPLKLFLPISLLAFILGTALYTYTFSTDGRFTNMAALLYMTSLLVFLIGLVSEQITALMFSRKE